MTHRDVEAFSRAEVLPGEDLARRAVDVELRVLRALQRVGDLGVGALVTVVGHRPVGRQQLAYSVRMRQDVKTSVSNGGLGMCQPNDFYLSFYVLV